MKSTKKLTALLLAAAMVLICAACGSAPASNGDAGLYVGTAMQDEGSSAVPVPDEGASSPIMEAVYQNFVSGEGFSQLRDSLAGLAHFETELKGDAIEFTAVADNEWYESMNGTWDYVLDGDYITLTSGTDNYTGISVFSLITRAVAEYLGMDPELVGLYTNAVVSQGLNSKYYVLDQNGSAGTITQKIYVAGQYDMQAVLDSAYVTEQQATDMGPLDDGYKSTVLNAGKVSVSVNGSKDSVDFTVAEYGGNTDLTYKSLISAVKGMQPTGCEEFLADYTVLEEAATEQYQVKFLTSSDEIPFAFEDFSSNYRYVVVHFGSGDNES